jgi:hypothetical protein
VTYEGFAAPGEPVIEIEGWEASAGTTKTVHLPPTGTSGPTSVTVRVPPGVADNALLRLPGAAPPPGPGLPPGDVMVRVRVRNPIGANDPFAPPIDAGTPLPQQPTSGLGYPPPGDPYGAPISGPGYPQQPVSGAFGPPPQPVSGGFGATQPVSGAFGQPGMPGQPYPPPGYPPPGGFMPPPARPAGSNTKKALLIGGVVVLVLALCGVGAWAISSSGNKKTPTGGSQGTAGSTGHASPAPSPLTADAYQTALGALDTAIAPGFTELKAAHTPSKVNAAITDINSALSTQIDTLREVTPPANVASVHAAFLDALTGWASDLQSEASSATDQTICGGTSALSAVTSSDGANQVRTVAKTMSTADSSHPFQVATALPAAVGNQNRRPANGAYLKSTTKGSGKLKITNGGSTDAAVSLVSGNKAILTMYIRAKGNFTAGRIKDGNYKIFVTTGTDYDTAAKAFTRNCDFSSFDQTANYRTTSSTYTQYSITLTPVAGGNASTSGVDPNNFPS